MSIQKVIYFTQQFIDFILKFQNVIRHGTYKNIKTSYKKRRRYHIPSFDECLSIVKKYNEIESAFATAPFLMKFSEKSSDYDPEYSPRIIREPLSVG